MSRLVFVGSTSRDLPDEREAVRTACDELGLAVVDMKDFPATAAGATAASLAQLDRAGVYVGVFARRYGYVEPGYPASVTECEYDHAGSRGLARLCFLLHPSVAWPDDRVEHAALDRLAAFQERIARDQVVRWFVNPHDLHHQVYRALEHWLRQQGERRGPCSLAMPAADFVGREDDLAELERQHAAGVAISGVQGQGGVGKTELARKLAERLASRCPDGLIEIDLRGVDPVPVRPRDAQARIVREFRGVEHRVPDDDAALLAEYRATLAGKRVLLLLDNAGSAEQVEALLPPAGTPAVVLVTSRRRLAVKGLRRHDLDALPADAATALVRSLVPRLNDAEAADVAQACGRLPLALRLAGTALGERPDWTAADYLRRLQTRGRLNVLDGVWLVIAESEDLLSEPKKAAWPALAVFASGFEKAWAAAIWAVDEDTADDYLGELQRHSLLSWDADDRLYHLHDLVREYADGQLDTPTRAALELHHAEFFRDQLRSADELFRDGGDGVTQALARFERIATDIQTSFRRAQGAPNHEGWQRLCVSIPLSGAYLFALRHLPRDQIEWLTVAAAFAKQLGARQNEGACLGNLGVAYAHLGQPQLALELYEQALSIARDVGDRRGEGAALGNLGSAYMGLGQHQRAIDIYLDRLLIAREVGDRRGESACMSNLGNAYRGLGQPTKAVEFLEQALSLSREIGDRQGEGTDLGSLGLAYADLGQTQHAIEVHQQALKLSRDIGDRHAEGKNLAGLGQAYLALGVPTAAIECYEQQLSIVRELGDCLDEGVALTGLGKAYQELGKPQQGVEFLEQALSLSRETGDRQGEGTNLGSLGLAYAALGQPQNAIECYLRQLTIAREFNAQQQEGMCLVNLGNAYADLGQPHQAIDAYSKALVLFRELGDRLGESVAALNLGSVYSDLDFPYQAIDCYREQLTIARQNEDQVAEALASWNLGAELVKLGQIAEAIPLLEVRVHFLREMGNLEAEQDAVYVEELRRRLVSNQAPS